MFFKEMTPEEYENFRDREIMKQQDAIHQVESFVYGLGKDDLYALSLLLGQVSGSKTRTSYWRGQVDGLLRERHSVCPIHGINHDEEALNLFNEGSTDITASAKKSAPGATEPEQANELDIAVDEHGRNLDDVLDAYSLSWNFDKQKFECVRCGYPYPSLKDRMMKSTDDCPGCMAKAGQG